MVLRRMSESELKFGQRWWQVLAVCLWALLPLRIAQAQTSGIAYNALTRYFKTTAAQTSEIPSLIVTSNADVSANDGQTTLREAIAYARTFPANQIPIVTFASNLTGTITLGGSNIDISRPFGSSLTISGPGANVLSLNGNATSNVFYSDGVGSAAISGLTFTNGLAAKGGAIQTVPNANDKESSGILSVSDCIFNDNRATTEAGAINGGCVLRLLRCAFLNNRSDGFQGAVQFFSYAQNRPSSATDCTFSGNNASSAGGAVAIYADGLTTLTNCVFTGNSVANQSRGGAVQLNTDADDTVNFTNCTFNDNRAPGGEGGALAVFFCPRVTLTNCRLSQNSASKGAAVSAISSTGVIFVGCTLNDNTAGSMGGGVFSAVPLNFTNCTLSGNSAGGSGGAIALSVPQSNATLSTQFTTLTANSAADGGGIHLGSGTGNISRSIVAGNSAPSNPDLRGAYISGGFNVIGKLGSATGFGANDRTGTIAAPLDARLATLADKGGLTLTHALMLGSPALDLAPPLAGTTTDQRGVARPISGNGDAGAFEAKFSPMTIDLNGSAEGNNVTTAFTEQTPVVLAPNLVITNDAGGLNSATVQLSQNPDKPSETLSANTNGTQISAHYDAATRTLILSGADSVAHYQQVLASIKYNNLSDTPHTTNRTLIFSIHAAWRDSVSAIATLTVTPIDDAPVAIGQSAATNEDTPLALTLSASDVDTPAANLTYRIITPPAHGVLAGTAPNLVYTPNPNFNGADAFSFVVNDGTSDSKVVPVTLQVLAINDAPVAEEQSLSIEEDSALNILLSANDIDTPAGALTFRIVAPPQNGTLSGVAPNLIYAPNPNFNGSDSFIFVVNDGLADSNAAMISLQVLAINDAPIAIAQQLETDNATPLAITLSATDIDNDALSFVVTGGPQHGTIAGAAPNLMYIANAGFRGSDAFIFHVSDGVATAQATITIVVSGDAAVIAVDDSYNLVLGTAGQAQQSDVTLLSSGIFQIRAPGVLLNDSFPTSSVLTVRAISNPQNGRFQLRNDGTLFYLPTTGKVGVDEFTYAISDGKTSSVARVRLNLIDQRAPELAFDTPRDREVLDKFTIIRGRVRDRNAGLKTVTLLWQRFDGKFWNGKMWTATATELPLVVQGINWIYSGNVPKPGANATTDLIEGRYDLRVSATDNANNVSRVTNRVTVSRNEPTAAGLSNIRLSSASASVSQNAIVLHFTGAINATSAGETMNYSLIINGAKVQVQIADYADNSVFLSGFVLAAGDAIELSVEGLREATGKTLKSGTINLTGR